MDASIGRGLSTAVAVAGFVFFDCVAAPAAPDGPFARIPALTTACYESGDQFVSKLDAAKETVARERDRWPRRSQRCRARRRPCSPRA